MKQPPELSFKFILFAITAVNFLICYIIEVSVIKFLMHANYFIINSYRSQYFIYSKYSDKIINYTKVLKEKSVDIEMSLNDEKGLFCSIVCFFPFVNFI